MASGACGHRAISDHQFGSGLPKPRHQASLLAVMFGRLVPWNRCAVRPAADHPWKPDELPAARSFLGRADRLRDLRKKNFATVPTPQWMGCCGPLGDQEDRSCRTGWSTKPGSSGWHCPKAWTHGRRQPQREKPRRTFLRQQGCSHPRHSLECATKPRRRDLPRWPAARTTPESRWSTGGGRVWSATPARAFCRTLFPRTPPRPSLPTPVTARLPDRPRWQYSATRAR